MNSNAGSYRYASFRDSDRELLRLSEQAWVGRARERALLQRSGVEPGTRVLDLACGPGLVSQEIANLVGPGSVVGTDIDAGIIETARRLASAAGIDNLDLVVDDIYASRLSPRSFDFVYARLLFQHLQSPDRALSTIHQLLRPGGTLCVVDVDDGLFALHPEPPALARFMHRAQAGQRAAGGDRKVGRKLPSLLAAAGFSDIRVQVEHFDTTELGARAFLDITTGFKLEQVPADQLEQATKELEEIAACLEDPAAFGTVGVFVVTGTAPGTP
jgi:ubiquinone/menaquinone biosynthesis C-methylase UbiE